MNKFSLFLFAFVALNCFVGSQGSPIKGDEADFKDDEISKVSLEPTDIEEVAELPAWQKPFADFCKSSRDDVITDMHDAKNERAAELFSLLMRTAADVGLGALKNNEQAAEAFSRQLADPSAEIAPASESMETAERIIHDAQVEIKSEQVKPPFSFFKAVISTIASTGSRIATDLMNRLGDMLKGVDTMQVVGALGGACDYLNTHDQKIRAKYAIYVQEASAYNASLVNLPIEDVLCVTSRRVITMGTVCNKATKLQKIVSGLFKSVSDMKDKDNKSANLL